MNSRPGAIPGRISASSLMSCSSCAREWSGRAEAVESVTGAPEAAAAAPCSKVGMARAVARASWSSADGSTSGCSLRADDKHFQVQHNSSWYRTKHVQQHMSNNTYMWAVTYAFRSNTRAVVTTQGAPTTLACAGRCCRSLVKCFDLQFYI